MILQIAARPGAQHLRCLYRVTFVPRDAYSLLRRDTVAFEYLYHQVLISPHPPLALPLKKSSHKINACYEQSSNEATATCFGKVQTTFAGVEVFKLVILCFLCFPPLVRCGISKTSLVSGLEIRQLSYPCLQKIDTLIYPISCCNVPKKTFSNYPQILTLTNEPSQSKWKTDSLPSHFIPRCPSKLTIQIGSSAVPVPKHPLLPAIVPKRDTSTPKDKLLVDNLKESPPRLNPVKASAKQGLAHLPLISVNFSSLRKIVRKLWTYRRVLKLVLQLRLIVFLFRLLKRLTKVLLKIKFIAFFVKRIKILLPLLLKLLQHFPRSFLRARWLLWKLARKLRRVSFLRFTLKNIIRKVLSSFFRGRKK